MQLPSINDLVLYVNKVLKGADWNTNFRAILNWLTNGNYSVKVKGIEVGSEGISNSGTFSQSGNLGVTGNITASGTITAGSGGFVGDGSQLTGIVSAAQVAYTPFCANSGNVNSSGNADILYYSGNTLKFKVGGTLPAYANLVCTTAKGVTFTIEQLVDVDCSTKDDGTYLVCVEKGSGSYSPNAILYKNGTVYVQATTPNGNENDLWLDISKEGVVSYQKTSGSWNSETELVPIGIIVISSHTITSVTTWKFNECGYNVNGRSVLKVGITKEAIEELVSGAVDTVYGPLTNNNLVIVGREGQFYDNAEWYLEVSPDNTNWTKVVRHSISNGDPANAILATVVVGAGMYFRAHGDVIDTIKYAPLFVNYNNNIY